ncbi:hypothetical protein V8C26DRAFT_147486 [Trichoderma gracile]
MQPHPLALLSLPSSPPSIASLESLDTPSCIIITHGRRSPVPTATYQPRPAAALPPRTGTSLRRLPVPDSVPRRVHASRRRGHPCQSMPVPCPCHGLLGGKMVVMANQGGDGWRTSWPLKWELAHARDPPDAGPAYPVLCIPAPPAHLLTYLLPTTTYRPAIGVTSRSPRRYLSRSSRLLDEKQAALFSASFFYWSITTPTNTTTTTTIAAAAAN